MAGQCGDPNTDNEKRLIYITVGYFIYDYLALLFYGLVDSAMVIHHSFCIFGMTLPLTYGKSANFVVMGMFIGESSNPFMHIRAILKHYGLRYTKAYESMDIIFMLLFTFGRIIFGAKAVWNTCVCEENHILVRVSSAALML